MKFSFPNRFLIVFGLLTCFSFGMAQEVEQKQAHFPEDFLGSYYGNLEIFNASGKTMELPMELHLHPTDSTHRWTWTIVYRGETLDERKYELVLVDSAKSHFQIDEKNSILLDGYWYGNTFTSRFSVKQSLLLINYVFEGDGKARFEVFPGNMENKVETGMEIEDSRPIYAYPMSGIQRAQLQKK